jgi:MinD-like ATPase involved in chromosome partitioning or flagellar assembly
VKEIISAPIIGTIPEDYKVPEAISRNMPVVLYAPNSPAGKAYRQLAANLMETDILKDMGRGST